MDIIKSSSEISELFSEGQRLKNPYVTLIAKKRVPGENTDESKQHDLEGRVAFIAGKKLGNAVWRNGAKRRMRSVCHELGYTWQGYDVIFLAKSSLMRTSYSKVLKACDKTIRSSCLENRE